MQRHHAFIMNAEDDDHDENINRMRYDNRNLETEWKMDEV